ISQLGEAGLPITDEDQTISDKDKMELLTHLRSGSGAGEAGGKGEPKKITLRRKTVSELKQNMPAPGRVKAKTRKINVEYRGKRTYAMRGDLAAVESAEAAAKAEAIAAAAPVAAPSPQPAEAAATPPPAERRPADGDTHEVQPIATPVAENAAEAAPAATPDTAATPAAAPAPAPATDEKSADKKGKRRKKREHRETRYGREELHVAGAKLTTRRKKKSWSKAGSVSTTRHGFEMPTQPIVREVTIPQTITVGELAQKMSVKAAELIK